MAPLTGLLFQRQGVNQAPGRGLFGENPTASPRRPGHPDRDDRRLMASFKTIEGETSVHTGEVLRIIVLRLNWSWKVARHHAQ